MRRKSSLWIVVLVSALLIVGCGTQGAKPAGEAAKPAAAPAAAPAKPAQPAAAPAAPAKAPAPAQKVDRPAAMTKVVWAGGEPDPSILLGAALGLGYFKAENIDWSFLNAGSTTSAIRAVEAGQAQYGVAPPSVVLQTLAASKGDIPHVGVYNYTPGWKYRSIALPNSPIKTLADLKGKKVGVQALGLSSTTVAQALIKAAGLDPEKDVKFIAVGQGPTLIKALNDGVADIFVGWDTNFGPLDVAGFKYKDIPFQPNQDMKFVGATGALAHRDYIKQNPAVIKSVGRALARATVFVQTNPKAAEDAYFAAFPQFIPKGMSYAQALDVALANYVDRIKNYTHPDMKTGAWSELGWQNEVKITVLKDFDKSKVDVKKLFSNEFVDYYNDFDKAPIIEQAKNWKFTQR